MARKKKKTRGEKKQDIGGVMTCSLFLILLTFFILLNSIAVLDEKRVRLSIGSLLGAFGSLDKGFSPSKSGDIALPPSSPMVKKEILMERILSLIQKDTPGEISLETRDSQEVLVLDDKILFDEKNHELKKNAHPFLDEICTFIADGTYKVEIAGHAAGVPVDKNQYRSNWELSTSMAMKVLKYFESNGGIKANRLEAYGYADKRPAVTNGTRLSREKNSRVEIIIHEEMPPYKKRIFMKKPSGVFTYKEFDFNIF